MINRTETDYIGECNVPANALYGIHSQRAAEIFPFKSPFNLHWYKAVGLTKLACYQTIEKFKQSAETKFDLKKLNIRLPENQVLQAMQTAAAEMHEGLHFEYFLVSALQGGAGTAINLNCNEIIANRALQILGEAPGNYQLIDPLNDANLYQSTNDVIPTALKLAVMGLLNSLEESINQLRFKLEALEKQHRNTLRIGYTQMQAAVPTSYGRFFGSYNEMLSRDWWRVSKCFERIKIVNLGGSAIGTSVAVPRFFVFEAVAALQKLTDLPIARAENLSDATANNDAFVEVHGILKAHAVNLEKMASDIRMLAADLTGEPEIIIPAMLTGSTIMPGKINPVIPEYIITTAHKIYANDALISTLAGQGMLELNAYLPEIGNAVLQSIEMLISANNALLKSVLNGMEINAEIAERKLYKSPTIVTVLNHIIGYQKASEIAKFMKKNGLTVFEANEKLNFIAKEQLIDLLKPENLLKNGFSIYDLASNRETDSSST